MGEILVIGILAIIFLGPERIPKAAKALGTAFREFKRATNTFKAQVNEDEEEDKRSKVSIDDLKSAE